MTSRTDSCNEADAQKPAQLELEIKARYTPDALHKACVDLGGAVYSKGFAHAADPLNLIPHF